jgi:hypothetical protein
LTEFLLHKALESCYFTSAVISAQKNASFPIKVSPHRSFDLSNQIAVIACQQLRL